MATSILLICGALGSLCVISIVQGHAPRKQPNDVLDRLRDAGAVSATSTFHPRATEKAFANDLARLVKAGVVSTSSDGGVNLTPNSGSMIATARERRIMLALPILFAIPLLASWFR